MTIRSLFSDDQLVDWWGEGKTADEFAQGMQSNGISDTATNIAEAIRIASGGAYTLKPEDVSSWVGGNQNYSNILDQYLSLPDFTYNGYDGERDPDKNAIETSSFLQDYYTQMAQEYLPTLDAFSQQNAGQMVGYDPNRFMSIEDFGLGTARGDLRGNIEQKWYLDDKLIDAPNSWQNYWVKEQNEYYDPNRGEYVNRPLTGYNGQDGGWNNFNPVAGELYSLNAPVNGYYESGYTPTPDGLSGEFTKIGTSRQETADEAVARLIAQGGGYKTGSNSDTNTFDFMGEHALRDLVTDSSGKWGSDPINNPELVQYLNDPNWVARDENGNITSIRAELYPLLMRESLGTEFRDITRGSTKEAGGFGDVMKSLMLGAVTGGLGLAGASALGLGTAAAGAGMGATMAGMGTAGLATAGAIGGGLSAGLTGNDILKGALTGGVLGGVGGIAKGYAPGISDSIGLSNVVGDKIGTNIISGGIKGLASGALRGDALSGAVGGMVNPALKGAVGLGADALFGGDGSSLPTDEQLAELQLTNPDAYDWYMFGDDMGNLDQTDYSWMVGNGEQTGYTGTAQGDTQMGWLDNLFSDSGVLGGDTQSFIDSLAIDSMTDDDALDWLANYDEFAPGADYSFNDNILDYFDTDGNNLLGSGSTMPDWFGNYDPLIADPNMTNLISNLNPDYSFGDLIEPGGGDLGSTIVGTGTDGTSGGGVLGSVKDAVQGLLGGGAAGAANSALIYELLKALMLSKQGEKSNELSADSVNMVINAGENGAPRRTGANFGAPRTSVGNVPPLTPVNNGRFQLGLTRN